MASEAPFSFGHRGLPSASAQPLNDTGQGTVRERRPALSVATVFLILGLALSAGVVGYATWWTQQSIVQDTVLQSRGVAAVGAVRGFYSTSGGRHSSPRLYARYTYEAPDSTGTVMQFQSSVEVEGSQYASVADARVVPVVYDPQSPAVHEVNWGNWLAGWTPRRTVTAGCVLGGGYLFIVWLLLGAIYLRFGRSRRSNVPALGETGVG